jgi:hypothetical protein
VITIGRENGWWNRKIRLRVKPILLVVGFVFSVILVYGFFGEVIQSCIWSITHRSTATYTGWPGTEFEGFSVKVPWMWRQKQGVGSAKAMELVRARVGSPILLDSVSIRRVDSPEDELKRLEAPSAKAKFAAAGIQLRVEPFAVDADVASHFSCVAMNIGAISTKPISCASTDGRHWLVSYRYIDPAGEIDLNPILRHLQ